MKRWETCVLNTFAFSAQNRAISNEYWMSLITLFINLIRVLIVSLYYLIAPWVFCSSCLDFYTEVITSFSKLSNGKFYSIVNKDFIWGATDCYLYAKYCFNPLTASPTKWSHTLKQFVGCCREIIWVCLTIL